MLNCEKKNSRLSSVRCRRFSTPETSLRTHAQTCHVERVGSVIPVRVFEQYLVTFTATRNTALEL